MAKTDAARINKINAFPGRWLAPRRDRGSPVRARYWRTPLNYRGERKPVTGVTADQSSARRVYNKRIDQAAWSSTPGRAGTFFPPIMSVKNSTVRMILSPRVSDVIIIIYKIYLPPTRFFFLTNLDFRQYFRLLWWCNFFFFRTLHHHSYPKRKSDDKTNQRAYSDTERLWKHIILIYNSNVRGRFKYYDRHFHFLNSVILSTVFRSYAHRETTDFAIYTSIII